MTVFFQENGSNEHIVVVVTFFLWIFSFSSSFFPFRGVNTVIGGGGGWSAWGAYNIGIFYWRPTPVAKALAKEWLQCLLGDDKIWDQNGFNDLARIQRGPAVGEDGLFRSYRGNLTMGILPVSLFCSGHTYFIQVPFQPWF